MIVTLQTRRLRGMGRVRAFVEGNESVDHEHRDRKSAYAFVGDQLRRLGYKGLGKRDKGTVRRFLAKTTGLSEVRVDRLIRQWRETGRIEDRRGGGRGRPFERCYTAADIRLLAEVDKAFGQMSGLAACELPRRQHEVFGDTRFERLAGISNGHVYNLRASRTHTAKRTVWTKTRAATAGIALRAAPDPRGMPGHLRVDTVHQGDRNGVKGANLVNIVDEVTRYEYVGAVPGISERFPVPLLEALLLLFPFTVLAFHADNGSEYINHRVAELLNTLHIPRFTKSRARRSNDNALVEGKNAHVVRKWFGHDHIPRRFAEAVNEFALRELSPFLNFHRPCLFGTEYRDDRGRLRRKYRRADVMTPYAKLKSLPGAGACLKDGATFAELDRSALAVSDLDAVGRVNDARRDLFRAIHLAPSRAA